MEGSSQWSYTKSERNQSSPDQMSLLTMTIPNDILVTGESGASGSLDQVVEQRALERGAFEAFQSKVEQIDAGKSDLCGRRIYSEVCDAGEKQPKCKDRRRFGFD